MNILRIQGRTIAFTVIVATFVIVGALQAVYELVIGTRFERWQAKRAYR